MNKERRFFELVVASGNEEKVRELSRLFDEPRLLLISMKKLVPEGFEVEETGVTFEENAWLKALSVCDETGKPALADDSGLEVDALGGRPGVYSARYAGSKATDLENNALLIRELDGYPLSERRARFRCVLAFAVPGSSGGAQRGFSASGVIEGRILQAPRGKNGFGYDPLFEALDGGGLTTAEMTPQEKNTISHRAKAAFLLKNRLISWIESTVLVDV